MVNISFLAFTKVDLWDMTVCIVINGKKNSKKGSDLDIGPTMPNIELFRVILIYYNIFEFHVPGSVPLNHYASSFITMSTTGIFHQLNNNNQYMYGFFFLECAILQINEQNFTN